MCKHSQSYDFSSSHIQMWELDHKCWVLKNWCFWIVVLEKTLGSPVDCKQIKPVNLRRNQPWIFIGRTDDEAEASVLWPPDVKRQLIRKELSFPTWCWERLKARGEEGGRRWDSFSITNSMYMNVSKLQEIVKDRETWRAASMGLQRLRHYLVTEQ